MKKKLKFILCVISICMMSAFATYSADDLSGVVNKTENLLNTVLNYLLMIIPALTAVRWAYYNGKQGGADQNEQSMWKKRQENAITTAIKAELGVALVNFIISQYQ